MAAHYGIGTPITTFSLHHSLFFFPLPKCPNHAHQHNNNSNTILNLAQSAPPYSSQLVDLRRRGKRRKWIQLPYCSAKDEHPSFGTPNESFWVDGENGLGNTNGSDAAAAATAVTHTLLGKHHGVNNSSNGNAEERSSDDISTSSDQSNSIASTSKSKSTRGGSSNSLSSRSSVEAITLAVKEPLYEVLQVNPAGFAVIKTVNRRQLLKSSGLRLRDIRSVDPSLRITNSMPALLIRDQAILLNLGSLRAITTPHYVFVFDHNSIGGQAFLELLFQRLNVETNGGIPSMPFELEVVESALLSWTQRLERRLMEIEPRVQALLEVLPNSLTANVLEELRVSKQTLVELGSEANAFRQVLLELLEHPHEIRRMTAMGRQSTLRKDDGLLERSTTTTHKQSADDEVEEIEMLLENYLQRCESCHGQAERLLDSAKEMEDSIAVNLSSRRLEVSRLELLLQVGTFCTALGALIAGIFGMNLKSYLEERMTAFWLMSFGIILGGIVLFFIMYNHLKRRKIL